MRITLFLSILVLSATGCGIPSLEPPSCSEAKTSVREFYSFHFGNGTAFSAESLEARRKYLTERMASSAAGMAEGTDPFTTGTTDQPRAFRVGECTTSADERAEITVLLFWRDDNASRQVPISVTAVKTPERWLVDKVEVINK
jgi:hypothetical protein